MHNNMCQMKGDFISISKTFLTNTIFEKAILALLSTLMFPKVQSKYDLIRNHKRPRARFSTSSQTSQDADQWCWSYCCWFSCLEIGS